MAENSPNKGSAQSGGSPRKALEDVSFSREDISGEELNKRTPPFPAGHNKDSVGEWPIRAGAMPAVLPADTTDTVSEDNTSSVSLAEAGSKKPHEETAGGFLEPGFGPEEDAQSTADLRYVAPEGSAGKTTGTPSNPKGPGAEASKSGATATDISKRNAPNG